jgi:hypothetical protein
MRSAITALVAVTVVSLAPTQVGGGDVAAADDAYRMQDYDAAVEGYAAVVRSDPKNGRAWFRIGNSEMQREKYAEALVAFQRALDLKYSIIPSTYNIACAHARNGDTARALDALERAIEIGYTPHDQIEIDPDLVSIRGQAQFASLIRRAREPVLYYSEGRKMANLAGTWSAGPDGVLTANVTSKGHAVRLDLVTGGSQELFLFFYFAAPDRWSVSGAGRDGSTFEGPVTFDGRDVVCKGKRTIEGRKVETRVRLSLDSASRGQLVAEAQEGGGWSVERSLVLDPSN